MQGPSLKDLWEEYAAVLEAIAPPLRDKNLGVFGDMVNADAPYLGLLFKYGAGGDVTGLFSQWWANLMARKTTVVGSVTELAKTVNSVEAASAQMRSNAASTEAVIAHAVSTGAALPAPPAAGAGMPSTQAPVGYVVGSATGVWTLMGNGAGVGGQVPPSANCIFAAMPWQSARGLFQCRVSAIANVNCPHLSQWAQVGLMAAGNLSSTAPAITLAVTGGNGVVEQVQSTDGSGWAVYTPASASASSGLIGSGGVTAANTKKLSNYLLKPLWLRLVRDGTQWTAYTSLDGSAWTEAASAAGVLAAGVWVGLFATAHNSSFGGKGQIRATFDHLEGFTPDRYVQVGAP